MTIEKTKDTASEVFMWIRHTLLVLLVIEIVVAHAMAYLYMTNFKVQVLPVVKIVSPI